MLAPLTNGTSTYVYLFDLLTGERLNVLDDATIWGSVQPDRVTLDGANQVAVVVGDNGDVLSLDLWGLRAWWKSGSPGTWPAHCWYEVHAWYDTGWQASDRSIFDSLNHLFIVEIEKSDKYQVLVLDEFCNPTFFYHNGWTPPASFYFQQWVLGWSGGAWWTRSISSWPYLDPMHKKLDVIRSDGKDVLVDLVRPPSGIPAVYQLTMPVTPTVVADVTPPHADHVVHRGLSRRAAAQWLRRGGGTRPGRRGERVLQDRRGQ